MHEPKPDSNSSRDARSRVPILTSYREPSFARSIFELTITAVPFAFFWTLMWAALDAGYWPCLVLAAPAAGFLVRLFMIQHDCGHGSFFRHRVANDWVGRAIGVLTLTPYDFWRRAHALHHANSGNLGRRGIGDIDTLTVHEYLSQSRWGRLRYRLYRHPIVMFGLGPAYLFLFKHRLPIGLMRAGWQPWLSTMAFAHCERDAWTGPLARTPRLGNATLDIRFRSITGGGENGDNAVAARDACGRSSGGRGVSRSILARQRLERSPRGSS